nr:hypothetical protein Iba_chr12bCG14610 [Ipomoea batatas]GMD63414.1 hypothetical protein Iba_chr12bCG14620 [Ipomoea batatas]
MATDVEGEGIPALVKKPTVRGRLSNDSFGPRMLVGGTAVYNNQLFNSRFAPLDGLDEDSLHGDHEVQPLDEIHNPTMAKEGGSSQQRQTETINLQNKMTHQARDYNAGQFIGRTPKYVMEEDDRGTSHLGRVEDVCMLD